MNEPVVNVQRVKSRTKWDGFDYMPSHQPEYRAVVTLGDAVLQASEWVEDQRAAAVIAEAWSRAFGFALATDYKRHHEPALRAMAR